jgi:hypothetical protein
MNPEAGRRKEVTNAPFHGDLASRYATQSGQRSEYI